MGFQNFLFALYGLPGGGYQLTPQNFISIGSKAEEMRVNTRAITWDFEKEVRKARYQRKEYRAGRR